MKRLPALTPIALLLGLLVLAAACDQSTPTPTPTSTATPTLKPTATPTPEPDSGPGASCQDRLALSLSFEAMARDAVVTSYRCDRLYIDSTGQYPDADPSFAVPTGAALELAFDPRVQQPPVRTELRLYTQTGAHGWFLQFPDDLPDGAQAIDRSMPAPALSFRYRVDAPPGEYALVVRATWEGPVDVFYATSLRIVEPS